MVRRGAKWKSKSKIQILCKIKKSAGKTEKIRVTEEQFGSSERGRGMHENRSWKRGNQKNNLERERWGVRAEIRSLMTLNRFPSIMSSIYLARPRRALNALLACIIKEGKSLWVSKPNFKVIYLSYNLQTIFLHLYWKQYEVWSHVCIQTKYTAEKSHSQNSVCLIDTWISRPEKSIRKKNNER